MMDGDERSGRTCLLAAVAENGKRRKAFVCLDRAMISVSSKWLLLIRFPLP